MAFYNAKHGLLEGERPPLVWQLLYGAYMGCGKRSAWMLFFAPHRIKTGAFVCGVSNNRYICITIYKVVSQMGSNWSEQHENRRERREKDKISREVLGKFFYDLAKLVFTAMALVGGVALIIGGFQVVQAVLLLLGLGLTYVLAYIGYKILNA